MKGWAIALGPDGKGHAIEPAAACANAPSRAAFTWVHLDGNADETLAWLKAHGGMPAPVIHALTAMETRPRCDAIEDGALVNLRGLAEGDAPDDRLVSIRAWVEEGRAVTVGFRPLAGFGDLRTGMDAGAIRDPGDLISQLAIAITKRLDPVIADLGDLVDDCETELDPDRAFETRRKIAGARSEAIVYRRFVVPEREALGRLAELGAGWMEEDDRLHLREAADRFARMAEELEAVRERSALVHEQLTDLRAEQIDRRALLLSVVALVFLPLTFLTGLLGMNVDGIPDAHNPHAFLAVCVICGGTAVVIGAWFALAHWFRK